jgi:hexosaminidase
MESITRTILPKPQSVKELIGEFLLDPDHKISWHGEGADQIAFLLAEYLRPATGFSLPVEYGTGGDIQLVSTSSAQPDLAGFVDESYQLVINDSVTITAPNSSGLARGIQTFRQLLPAGIFKNTIQLNSWIMPCVVVQDAPRFRWRGQHLDVSRHFFSVKEVCNFIDLLALHRLNIFHIHLTDDQGWRIEIKKYPRLTEIGSVRNSTLIGHNNDHPQRYDGITYGGYYTQEDIRTIVNYASARHIIVVPEIDMPGHTAAAIAAYPELGNQVKDIQVRCHWGVSQHILNADNQTIEFMKDVLSEVMDLFPGTFIHIGGDEAPKDEWKKNQRIQQKITQLGIKNEEELQTWFLGQIVHHIAAGGRRMIGWDEILEGGLPEGAAVMSWRGEAGGLMAAALGHDVVMAPNQRVYFDHYQTKPSTNEPLAIGGYTPLEQVYHYEPIPIEMPEDQFQHILGSQGQLWTEYIKTIDHLEYMAFPRICALAETLWLETKNKNYQFFLKALKTHRKRLENIGVNSHPKP